MTEPYGATDEMGVVPDLEPADAPDWIARIEVLESRLAECYRLTGEDPDGNADWMLAGPHVVDAVRALRQEVEDQADRIESLEAGIRRHRELSNEERVCCDACLKAGKEPWAPERDTELWSLLDQEDNRE